MDILENLKEDPEEMSPEEEINLRKYLGATDVKKLPTRKRLNPKNTPTRKASNWMDMSKWKIVGILVISYVILSSSIASSLINKLPMIDGNDTMSFLFSIVIFALIAALTIFMS